jgi:oxygen-independent coproporphyrinogen III oxidase
VQNFRSQPMAERPLLPPAPRRMYVHIPYCNYHCTFCFYAVRTGAPETEKDRYVAAVLREAQTVPHGTTLTRLVVGGGTPTALAPALLRRLLAGLFEWLPSAPHGAHTLEASPDSLTAGHLDVLEESGIHRVSLGIESLDPSVLSTVHRRHSIEQAMEACRLVADRGLSFNVDLIYGLPGQTMEGFRRDLEAVARTGATSLCLYGLRLNDRTAVANQLRANERLELKTLLQWRSFIVQAAADVGYVQTRPYSFKRADLASSWHERREPAGVAERVELALGMSARAQLGAAVYRNHDRADVYMARVEQGQSPVESVFELDAGDRRMQLIAATLGNGRPLDKADYLAAIGSSIDADYGEPIERLRRGGLIVEEQAGTGLSLTALGRLLYDRVLLCFLPERASRWLTASPVTIRGDGRLGATR